VDRAVAVVADAAVPEQVPERVRRLAVELLLPRMVRLLPEPAVVDEAVVVADAVVREAALLLPNRLHDLQMEP
jgi:hypothetical protein